MIKLNRFSPLNETSIYSGNLLSIPLKVLKRKKGTKAYQILEFISLFQEDGVSYSNIVKFIVEKLQGKTYDYRTDRGYYSANLNGSSFKLGLLKLYCDRLENGKYILKPEVYELIYSNIFPSELLDAPKELQDRHISAMRRLSSDTI